MIRNLLFIVIFFILFSGCNSKPKDNTSISATQDSIQKYLALARNDTLDLEKRIKYNDKVLPLIVNYQNSLQRRRLLYEIISNYYPLESWDKYKKATNLLYKNSLSSNDSTGLAQAYRSYGNYYTDRNILDSSFYYFTKSERMYKRINDLNEYSRILYKKGLLQYHINDFLAADLSLSKAYSAAKKTNNSRNKYDILNQLGLISNGLKKFDDAIKYFNEALKIAKTNNFPQKKHLDIVSLSNIGLIYQNLKKHDTAIKYFNTSLKCKNLKYDHPFAYSNIVDNLAYSKFQINDHKLLPDLFFQSLQIRTMMKDTSSMVTSNIHLSEYYAKMNEKQKALKYANVSLELSKLNKNSYDLLFSLKQILGLDSKNSFKHADDYLKIVDSLQLAERDSKDRFDRIQLETHEIKQEKETAIKQKWIVSSISGIIILIIALLLIITRQRNKQKELVLMQGQQKANEEIYQLMLSQKNAEEQARESEKKRIALELHDGVMNRLTSIRLNLSVIKMRKDEATLEKCMEYVNDIFNVETEIRNITHELRDSQATYDFEKLLKEFISRQNDSGQVKYSLEIQNAINWDLLADAKKMNLYRIIQEASQNINKHSKASKATISFLINQNNICLSITDNGIGMQKSFQGKGIGLKNMEYRANFLNGSFTIDSQKNNGTTLNISFPFRN